MSRLFIPLLIVLVTATLVPIPASAAVTREDVVKPFRDNIELFKEGLADVARQGQLRLKQIEEWKAWHTRLREALAESGKRQKEEDARRLSRACQFFKLFMAQTKFFKLFDSFLLKSDNQKEHKEEKCYSNKYQKLFFGQLFQMHYDSMNKW